MRVRQSPEKYTEKQDKKKRKKTRLHRGIEDKALNSSMFSLKPPCICSRCVILPSLCRGILLSMNKVMCVKFFSPLLSEALTASL